MKSHGYFLLNFLKLARTDLPNPQKYGKIFLSLSESISAGTCAILKLKLRRKDFRYETIL